MKPGTARLSVPLADFLADIWSNANTFDADGGLVSGLSAGVWAWVQIVAITDKVTNKLQLARLVILPFLQACVQDPYTGIESTRHQIKFIC